MESGDVRSAPVTESPTWNLPTVIPLPRGPSSSKALPSASKMWSWVELLEVVEVTVHLDVDDTCCENGADESRHAFIGRDGATDRNALHCVMRERAASVAFIVLVLVE